MTYYPLFIPLYHHHGSGGGGGNPKYIALAYIATIGLVAIGFNQITKPKFQMKICKNHFNKGTLNVDIRYKDSYPHVSSLKHFNIDLLQSKEYTISQPNQHYSQVYLSNLSWNTFATIRKNTISKNPFTEDCKECDVYTEIIYSYDNFFGNEVQTKKRLYWHKNYVEELK